MSCDGACQRGANDQVRRFVCLIVPIKIARESDCKIAGCVATRRNLAHEQHELCLVAITDVSRALILMSAQVLDDGASGSIWRSDWLPVWRALSAHDPVALGAPLPECWFWSP